MSAILAEASLGPFSATLVDNHAARVNAAARATCPAAFNPSFIDDLERTPEARRLDYACMYIGVGCAGLGAGVIVSLASYGLYRLGAFLTR